MSFLRRRLITLGTTIGVAVFLFVVVPPLFFPWSPLNCRHQEIDISSGKLRFSRYILYRKVSERIEESEISKLIPGDAISRTSPIWHRVNTFSPGVSHSPHYIFHGAIYQISTLTRIWAMSAMDGLPFTGELRRRTAIHLLALWQHSGDDSLADDYLNELFTFVEPGAESTARAILRDLEMPLIETDGPRIIRSVFYPTGNVLDRVEGYENTSGEFIKNGLWERWFPDGTKAFHCVFRDGILHGRKFDWDRAGTLSLISEYTEGRLTEFQNENLTQHPDYEVSRQVANALPAARRKSNDN